jgi:hypothetical protein
VVIKNIPFETTDWSEIKSEQHDGETGYALWKVRQCGELSNYAKACRIKLKMKIIRIVLTQRTVQCCLLWIELVQLLCHFIYYPREQHE